MSLIVKLGMVTGLLALAACGGGSPTGSALEEIPVVSKKPWVYNPNQKHAPVSLSGSDIVGLEPRVR